MSKPESSIWKYWKHYGGFASLRSSVYTRAALVVTFLLAPAWWHPGWWDISISVIGSLLGFSLGGFAILIGFGDDMFKQILAVKDNDDKAVITEAAAAYTHFIIIQIFALALAVAARFYYIRPPQCLLDLAAYVGADFWEINEFISRGFWFIGFLLFCYAIASAAAATSWLFDLCKAYVNVQAAQQEKEKHREDDNDES